MDELTNSLLSAIDSGSPHEVLRVLRGFSHHYSPFRLDEVAINRARHSRPHDVTLHDGVCMFVTERIESLRRFGGLSDVCRQVVVYRALRLHTHLSDAMIDKILGYVNV